MIKKYMIPYISYEGTERNYFPDFVLSDDTIIEVKPHNLVKTEANIRKFEAAKNKYGDKFLVITENEIHRLQYDEISALIEQKLLEFTDKHKMKLDEWKIKNDNNNLRNGSLRKIDPGEPTS